MKYQVFFVEKKNEKKKCRLLRWRLALKGLKGLCGVTRVKTVMWWSHESTILLGTVNLTAHYFKGHIWLVFPSLLVQLYVWLKCMDTVYGRLA